jgi:DNA transformation protein
VADLSFKDFVLDQLQAVANLDAKRMFGGHGLYQGDRFFGILMDGRLYFKTDEQSRTDYLARGATAFVYEKGKRIVSTNYYEVPPEILENPDELVLWATRAVKAAIRAETDADPVPSRSAARKSSSQKRRA